DDLGLSDALGRDAERVHLPAKHVPFDEVAHPTIEDARSRIDRAALDSPERPRARLDPLKLLFREASGIDGHRNDIEIPSLAQIDNAVGSVESPGVGKYDFTLHRGFLRGSSRASR